jgi:hypothetical protein
MLTDSVGDIPADPRIADPLDLTSATVDIAEGNLTFLVQIRARDARPRSRQGDMVANRHRHGPQLGYRQSRAQSRWALLYLRGPLGRDEITRAWRTS